MAATAQQAPPILLTRQKTIEQLRIYSKYEESAYDQSTYWGRVKHFKRLVNQLNYLYTEGELANFKRLLDDHEARGSPVLSDQENERLWHAKYILLGHYHPETNEPIHRLFRTSGYCLVSLPVILGFAFVPPTPVSQLITQTFNQSFNFAYNFYNGNASNTYSISELSFSYTMAVTASIVGSVGALKLIGRLRVSEQSKYLLSKTAPYLGIVVANELNLFFSRLQDFNRGIKLYDAETMLPVAEDQNSVEAARIAFNKTAVSRALIPASIFAFPYLYTYTCNKLNFKIRNRGIDLVAKSLVSIASLYTGLTYALAVFPQITKVPVERLEPCFQNLKRSNGQRISYVAFNRGL